MKVTILQWNIYWKQLIEPVIDFIRAVDPDIFCLQELMDGYVQQFDGDSVEKIKNDLHANAAYTYIHFKGKNHRQGNGVFTKHTIVSSRQQWIRESDESLPETFDNENRSYDEATIQIGGKSIAVGTTHMSYSHAFEDTERKITEGKRLLGCIPTGEVPYIMCGDLNSPSGSYVVSELDKVLGNLGPDPDQNTWTTKPFGYNGFIEDKLNWRLDHIYGKNITAVRSEILTTDVSDHLPLLIEVEI